MTFGEYLRACRLKAGLGLTEVAKVLRTSRQHLSRMERNMRHPPPERKWRRLETLIEGVEYDELRFRAWQKCERCAGRAYMMPDVKAGQVEARALIPREPDGP